MQDVKDNFTNFHEWKWSHVGLNQWLVQGDSYLNDLSRVGRALSLYTLS